MQILQNFCCFTGYNTLRIQRKLQKMTDCVFRYISGFCVKQISEFVFSFCFQDHQVSKYIIPKTQIFVYFMLYTVFTHCTTIFFTLSLPWCFLMRIIRLFFSSQKIPLTSQFIFEFQHKRFFPIIKNRRAQVLRL